MKSDSLRVRAPSSIVFLCGGALEKPESQPKMLRDVFYRIATLLPDQFKMVLAEEAKPLESDAGYDNLLSFESDIAQVVGVILLFAESPGSLAELGAFAALKTIAPSLIAVLDDYYYNKSSFIRHGPVKYLEKKYGDDWIHVLERAEIGIDEDGGILNLDRKKFAQSVIPAVERRLEKRRPWAKFDPAHAGHAILLMTGLIQEMGAMTISEIKRSLEHFAVEEVRINNFLYCSELLNWTKQVRKGNNNYYVATQLQPAVDYELNATIANRDKLRWRTDIRAHWAQSDPARMRAIAEVLSSSGATK